MLMSIISRMIIILALMALSSVQAGNAVYKENASRQASQKAVKQQAHQESLKERYAQVLRSPKASRGVCSRTRVLYLRDHLRLGPVNEKSVGEFKPSGKFTATQYADFFHGRMAKSGVRFDQYNGYTVAVKQFKGGNCYFPMGTVLLLRYECRGSYSYCLVVVSDSGRLTLHRDSIPQFDCSKAVSRALGLYCKSKKNYREGEYMVIHKP
jgi:hypothetical protein